MAQRRMVSLKIIDSAKFIKMPVSSRAFYYDLITRADDDGVVEAFNIMRITGATEDDLKVLVSKGFVIVLNDDLVSFITDWQEHNKIRPDRKTDSIYKNLLLKIVPDIELVDKRPRADSRKLIGQPVDVQWTENGQPKDGIGKVRLELGEDSVGKVNNTISKDIVSSTKVQPIIEKWNELGLSKITSINSNTNRYKMLNARVNEYGIDKVLEAIENINNSSFLKGQNKQGWTITFDWLIKPNNFIKVLENNYMNKNKENGSSCNDWLKE